MYHNLIFFLLVLVIYTTYEPPVNPALPGWAGLIFNIGLYAVYYLLIRAVFDRRINRLPSDQGASRFYHQATTQMSVVALVFYVLAIYGLGFKDLVHQIPYVDRSEALSGLLGLGGFALFLVLAWRVLFPLYRRLYHSRLSRRRFVWSQLRFNLPIILPWLLVSALLDMATLIPESDFKNRLDSPGGELVFLLIFITVLMIIFPVLIKPLWGLKPLPAGPHRSIIRRFSQEHDFHYRDIMLWPLYEGEGLTAGVMGLWRRWRYILVTKAILRVLEPKELEAVIGHELGHIRHRHLFLYFFFFLGYLVSAFFLIGTGSYLLMASGSALDFLLTMDGRSDSYLSLVMSLPMLILMVVYFRFIMGMFLRAFERQADLYSYRITGAIDGLVGSLEKIALYSGQSRNLPSWHHYSVSERVDFLNRCRDNPALIRRHQKKVQAMLAGFVLIMILLGWGGYRLQSMTASESYQQRVIHVLEAAIHRNPGSSSAYRALGDVYIQTDEPEKAMVYYERALALDPQNPEILNNMAWLLATKEGVTQSDAKRALDLALKAVEIDPAPHILDTLAETLWLNGRTAEAIHVIDRAIKAPGPGTDKQYLKEQKTKFESTRPNAF
jgi:Zn-dependent protease with chaperone function